MKRFSFLRKVVAIAICLAGVTMFLGCNKDDDPKKSGEQKGCWIVTNTVTCNVVAGVTVPPQTYEYTKCDLTEAQLKEDIRIAKEAATQTGCNSDFTYRRQ